MESIELYRIQIIETIIVLFSYILVYTITSSFINKTLKKVHFQRERRKFTIKAVNLFTLITAATFLSAIWGLKQHEIAVFVGSILTALGIGFFAQWSLLSNITSSIILFFNHPIKLGDTIKVLDKESLVEGEVTDLTYFFVYLKTKEGDLITIPNSLLLQKSTAIIASTKKTKN